MATTAIEIDADVAGECYQRRVQELTDVVASHSLRFRRIALRHPRRVFPAAKLLAPVSFLLVPLEL